MRDVVFVSDAAHDPIGKVAPVRLRHAGRAQYAYAQPLEFGQRHGSHAGRDVRLYDAAWIRLVFERANVHRDVGPGRAGQLSYEHRHASDAFGEQHIAAPKQRSERRRIRDRSRMVRDRFREVARKHFHQQCTAPHVGSVLGFRWSWLKDGRRKCRARAVRDVRHDRGHETDFNGNRGTDRGRSITRERHLSASAARTADSSSWRVKGFGSTLDTPNRRATPLDVPRPRWNRAETTRIGAEYASCSERIKELAARGFDTFAMTRRGLSVATALCSDVVVTTR